MTIESHRRFRMKKTHLLIGILAVLLTACEPTIANRGDNFDSDDFAKIIPGTTTREEVATLMGTPTSISTFDEKIWYYVGRQTKQYSFLDPEIIGQQAAQVVFNDQGVVTEANKLDLSKTADVETVERTTPTYGQENTFLKQLLGDLSHPMPNIKDKHGGNGQ